MKDVFKSYYIYFSVYYLTVRRITVFNDLFLQFLALYASFVCMYKCVIMSISAFVYACARVLMFYS